MHALAFDSAVSRCIVDHEFQLQNVHFFESVIPKIFGEVSFQPIKEFLKKMCNSKSEEEHDV